MSSICAVLAETDVINMVSRGIATPDILKGIHLSMASRIVKLLKVTGIKEGTALITGGLALDTGLLAAIQEEMVNEKVNVTAVSHPDSIYAGAIGAALWGAFRHAQAARACRSARPPERRAKENVMALLINDNCTACDACKPVCPNEAISVGDPIYVIDPLRCTECVGAEDEPQCKLVCPADCIVPNPDFRRDARTS